MSLSRKKNRDRMWKLRHPEKDLSCTPTFVQPNCHGVERAAPLITPEELAEMRAPVQPVCNSNPPPVVQPNKVYVRGQGWRPVDLDGNIIYG